MIAKRGRARIKSGARGGKDLVAYITDQGKAHDVTVSNCKSVEDGLTDGRTLEIAVAEIVAQQQTSRHADDDNMYHLIVSFQEGERPDRETMQAIEAHLVSKLGFDGHSRISAIHDDTDNYHLHVTVCKIHPETGRRVTPYYDNLKMSEGCRELEVKFGLVRDKGLHYITPEGEIKLDSSRNRAKRQITPDMKNNRGIESFQAWVGKEPANALRHTLKNPEASWQDVHSTLDRYNLKLVPRGNGFAVVDRDNPKLAATASQVGRFFAKATIENRLGRYLEPDRETSNVRNQNRTVYVERPSLAANQARREKASALYEEFRRAKTEGLDARKVAMERHRESVKERRQAIVEQFRNARARVKAEGLTGPDKQAALSLIAMDRAVREKELREAAIAERRLIREECFVGHYRQYLMNRAADGDEAALAALRGLREDKALTPGQLASLRKGNKGEPTDCIVARSHQLNVTHHVHSNGDVTYRVNNKEALRDEGQVVRVYNQTDSESLELGLRLAQRKFAGELTLTGSDDFKKLAVETAVEKNIRVTFVDPKWQGYYEQLQSQREAERASWSKASPQNSQDLVTYTVPVAEKEQASALGLHWNASTHGWSAERGSEADKAAAQRWPEKASQPETPNVARPEKVTFAVPYKEKDEARELGLVWDRSIKGYSAEQGSAAAQAAAQRWPEKKSVEAPAAQAEPLNATVHPSTNAPSDSGLPRSAEDLAMQRNRARENGVPDVPPHRVIETGQQVRGSFEGLRELSDGSRVALIEQKRSDGQSERVIVPVTKQEARELDKLPRKNKADIEGQFDKDRGLQYQVTRNMAPKRSRSIER